MQAAKGQFNFNTLLSLILSAMVGLTIKKLDESNTLLIELKTYQMTTNERLNALELKESIHDSRINKAETMIEVIRQQESNSKRPM